jgi:MSHA biogenesis protein MshQ
MNTRLLRIQKTGFAPLLIFCLLLFLSGWSHAAAYTLPAAFGTAPFAGCTYNSGTQVAACTSSITLAAGDVVNLTASITLNINGSFDAGGGSNVGTGVTINNNSGFSLLINANQSINIGNGFQGVVNLTATQTINVNTNSSFIGNLTASTLNISGNTQVSGICTPTNSSCTGAKVNQATLTATGPTSVTYGNVGALTSSGGSGTGAVTYSAGASTGCSVSGTTLSVTNASGTCSVTATKAADSNYNATTSAAFTVTLVKAALTITANNDSKTYTGVAYSGGNGVVYSGFVNSETSSVLAGTLSYGGTAQGAVNVGSYAITPGGLTSANYTISYVNGTLTIAAPTASAFNVFESSTAAGVITGKIYTKLAGTGFNLDVVAVASASQANSFSGNVKLELLANSGAAGAGYGSDNCPTSNGVIQTVASAAIVGGRSTAAFLAVAQASRDVRVRVTYPVTSPTVVICSTDSFAIRPSAVSLSTTAAAVPPSASATPIIKTGSSFTLNATATAGYTGTVTQDTSRLTSQTTVQDTTVASGGVVGILTPSTLAVNASPAPTANAAYDEVGYLYLAAGAFRDEAFTAVDQPAGCAATGTCDCVTDATGNNNLSASLVGSTGRYGCYVGSSSAALGRFIPDHFSVTRGAPVAACTVHPAPAAGYIPTDFTYFSQPEGFTTPFTITALSAAATAAPTKNYAGVFARLSTGGWAWTDTSAATGLRFGTGSTLPTGSVLAAATVLGTTVVPAGVWSNGAVTMTSVKHQIGRPSALTGETAVTVTALPKDADGVTMAAAGVISSSATKLRYGRLRLQNMYGSEKLPVAVPVQAQYWATNAFINNVDDSCAAVTVPTARTLNGSTSPDGLANLYFYPVATGTKNQLKSTDIATTSMASPLTGGVTALNFSKPGNPGWLDIILNAPDYLKDNWGNCMGQSGTAGLRDDFPCGRATFGVYKSPLIYRRENY